MTAVCVSYLREIVAREKLKVKPVVNIPSAAALLIPLRMPGLMKTFCNGASQMNPTRGELFADLLLTLSPLISPIKRSLCHSRVRLYETSISPSRSWETRQ
jgi:hypothetical protein